MFSPAGFSGIFADVGLLDHHQKGNHFDAANRLTGADFNQYTGGSFNKEAKVDFSVSGLSYDANGNIRSMTQILTYSYQILLIK